MNIVFVCREYIPTLRGGGIASYMYEVALNLKKYGHTITVICSSDDTRKYSDSIEDGIHVIRLQGGDFVIPNVEKVSILRKFRSIYRFFLYRKRILYTLNQLKDIDIVEVPEYGAEAYYLSELKVPVVIRLHTPTLLDRNSFGIKKCKVRTFYDYWVGKKEMSILPKFKYITSCSKSLKGWFDVYLPVISNNIEVIYNPIDLSKWNRVDVRYIENTILYVGTVAEGKGVRDLVDACAILIERGSTLTLKIAGKIGGSYAVELQQYVLNNNFTWCTFLGNLNRDELKYQYAIAKVSCFPSWWENMPLVCLEAMAMGNIVMGSSNGGMTEIISDGVDGFLFEPKNPLLLANKIEYALNISEDKVSQIRLNAMYKIKTKFSMEAVLKNMEKYYNNVITDFKNEKSPLG